MFSIIKPWQAQKTMDSIFDSASEKKVYKRLMNVWEGRVNIYPQLPVRKVIGYDQIRNLSFCEKAKKYLLETEFDFVVCSTHKDEPLLAVEFDGLGKGFSKNGSYHPKQVPVQAGNRNLKLNTKLKACDLAGVPLVIVSYEETNTVLNSNQRLTVLDAIIGEVLTGNLVCSRIQDLCKSGDLDKVSSVEAAEWLITEIEIESKYEANPIRLKTLQMKNQIGHNGYSVEWLYNRKGYAGARYSINHGVSVEWNESDGSTIKHKNLLSATIYIREVNCSIVDTPNLLEAIGEYCLYTKAIREVGTDPKAWAKLSKTTPWT